MYKTQHLEDSELHLILVRNASVSWSEGEKRRRIQEFLHRASLHHRRQHVFQSSNVDLTKMRKAIENCGSVIDERELGELTEKNLEGSGSQGSTRAARWKTMVQEEQAARIEA
ncbi:hypothetical protein VIGAN_02043200 [Vigna angularis var. angularis]|uniref:Uncharacterized protein n=1 Tax=Vigna angularis var. angularis TaxID=157739 RepID=A0A0S3RAW6_PHAAN|nr:hypothetical protein VIGAN_02043200 [Vigna angularis var. angularis]